MHTAQNAYSTITNMRHLSHHVSLSLLMVQATCGIIACLILKMKLLDMFTTLQVYWPTTCINFHFMMTGQ